MRDPFKKASRRIIRRLGVPVVMVTKNGVRLDDVKGVFSNPEDDALVKGKNGGLEFKHRQKTLRVMTDDCVGLSKDWRIIIAGKEYFPADHHEDGHGCTLIYLANEIDDPTESEIVNGGGKWR